MGDTTIEWTERTWNPTRGCSLASPGCEHCYAMGIAARFSGEGKPFEGFARFSPSRRMPQWTGKLGLVESALSAPLTWKKPKRIFVNSMSDVFHEALRNEDISAIFGIMAAAPQHTFQVLTKRATRMREWFEWVQGESSDSRYSGACGDSPAEVVRGNAIAHFRASDGSMPPGPGRSLTGYDDRWPLPNVWLGVSVENQDYADERVPDLLRTPAAVRFVSYEPALGPVDFSRWLPTVEKAHSVPFSPEARAAYGDEGPRILRRTPVGGALDWIIVGGESGRGARPFDVGWAEWVVAQCRDAEVACFVKQLGAAPYCSGHDGHPAHEVTLASTKGGDMDEWPEELRVRQFPEGTTR